MISPKYINQEDEVPKQLGINNFSYNEQKEQELSQVERQVQMNNQNYNYPQIQQEQKQTQDQLQNTQIINAHQQQPNEYPQYQAYVNVVPNIEQINENPLLYHEGQKKVFTLSPVILMGLNRIDSWIIYLCFFISMLIYIYTFKQNHPINKMNPPSALDKLLFIIYFPADVFTIFVIILFTRQAVFLFLYGMFRFCQIGNFICSISTLVQTNTLLKMRGIIIVTLILFACMLFIVACTLPLPEIYLFPVGWQISQFILTFHLIRVINKIYSKENKKVDINNIYTGFILFKYSYYIPQ